MVHKLKCFHARCVRCMCGVSLKDSYMQRISTGELLCRVGLEPLDYYLHRRQLRWLGHVARMGSERIPRIALSSWCNNGRGRGSLQMSYGRSICKALNFFHIDTELWHLGVTNKAWWKQITGRTPKAHTPLGPVTILANGRNLRRSTASQASNNPYAKHYPK